MGSTIYKTDAEAEQHARAMAAIAHELGYALEAVTNIYEAELARLQHGARIKDFLPILVNRRVREILRHRVREA